MRAMVTVLLVFTLVGGSTLSAQTLSAAAAREARRQAPRLQQAPPLVPALHKGRAPTLKPILIGAAIGAGLGVLTYRLCDSSQCGIDTLKATGSGAAAGATIGLVWSMR
jgi:hypothetical protein